MISDASWLPMAVSCLTGAAATYAMTRGRKQDSDARIDERVQLMVGEKLTTIQATLAAIQERLPSRDTQITDSGRLGFLEQLVKKLELDLLEAFNRVRQLETTCARCTPGDPHK